MDEDIRDGGATPAAASAYAGVRSAHADDTALTFPSLPWDAMLNQLLLLLLSEDLMTDRKKNVPKLTVGLGLQKPIVAFKTTCTLGASTGGPSVQEIPMCLAQVSMGCVN